HWTLQFICECDSKVQIFFIIYTPGPLHFEIKTIREIAHPALQKFLRLGRTTRQQTHADITELSAGQGDDTFAVLTHPFTLHIGNALVLTVDRKSTRLNSSHVKISYAGFCLKKKTRQ